MLLFLRPLISPLSFHFCWDYFYNIIHTHLLWFSYLFLRSSSYDFANNVLTGPLISCYTQLLASCSWDAVLTIPNPLLKISKDYSLQNHVYLPGICLPKFIGRNTNPAIDDIRRWELWRCFGDEGGAIMNGISVLIKETSQTPSPLLPCGDTASSYQNQVNQEKGPHQIVTMLAP